jgi:hypothetical protein
MIIPEKRKDLVLKMLKRHLESLTKVGGSNLRNRSLWFHEDRKSGINACASRIDAGGFCFDA